MMNYQLLRRHGVAARAAPAQHDHDFDAIDHISLA